MLPGSACWRKPVPSVWTRESPFFFLATVTVAAHLVAISANLRARITIEILGTMAGHLPQAASRPPAEGMNELLPSLLREAATV